MMKYLMIYIVFLSVYVCGAEVSDKPVSFTIGEIRRAVMSEMMTMRYTSNSIDKDTLKKKITSYPSPIELSKLFVKAYLSHDDDTMMKITPKENIDKLKTIDKKVREYFLSIEKYDKVKMVEFEGKMFPVSQKNSLTKQTVYLYIKGLNQQINFDFVWFENRWILLKVL